jgi:hypothetical protein
MKRIGRPPRETRYVHVDYAGKEYTVGFVDHKGTHQAFVIDREDFEHIRTSSWHVTATNYMSTNIEVDDIRKSLYLHNAVCGRFTFDGKGQTTSIDHINRNGFDNRKENLRLVSQSEQNINQGKKPRTATLPADSGITMDDVPRHIWYVKPNGLHGDRFAIEFKTEGLLWRSTSSKTVSLQAKLTEAKQKLAEFYTAYPHLDPDNPERVAKESQLNDSFTVIVEAARTKI